MKKPDVPPPPDRTDTGPPDRREPLPKRDALQEILDEGKGPLAHGGQVRGDQQALQDEAQCGGVERGTSHRGRSSQRRNKSHHR